MTSGCTKSWVTLARRVRGLETLTVTRLGVTGTFKRTLQSTNPIESMVQSVRWTPAT
jgi:hypothetical protein